jgi:peptidoglycan/LPS O-acetylase OafA/YrhL
VLASLFSAVHVVDGLRHRAWMIRQPSGLTVIDLGSSLANDVLTLGFLVTVVALSALTWRLIERPGQALFARFAASKAPVLTPQTA